MIVCESFRSLGVEGCSFTPADALTIQYIGEFVEQLVSGTLTPSRSSMIQNPYVVDQLKTGDYQTAGDTAVYGYFFLQERRRQQLTAKDYLHMASQSYLRWYGKQPTSIGYLLSERVERYLPVIQKVLEHTFPKIAPPLLRLV